MQLYPSENYFPPFKPYVNFRCICCTRAFISAGVAAPCSSAALSLPSPKLLSRLALAASTPALKSHVQEKLPVRNLQHPRVQGIFWHHIHKYFAYVLPSHRQRLQEQARASLGVVGSPARHSCTALGGSVLGSPMASPGAAPVLTAPPQRSPPVCLQGPGPSLTGFPLCNSLLFR